MTTSAIAKHLSPHDCKAMIARTADLQMIDVRSAAEFASEMLPGSKNIPLPELTERLSEISNKREILVLCKSGKRAGQAASTLSANGYAVTVLQGGLGAWQSAGLPLQKSHNCLPPERQAQIMIGSMVCATTMLGLTAGRGWLALTALLGAGQIFTALTGNCALAMMLARAPWNSSKPPKGS